MKYLVLCSAVYFLCTLAAEASVSIDGSKEVKFDLNHPFTLHCNVSEAASKNVTIVWKKEDKPISSDRVKLANDTPGKYTLTVTSAKMLDVGNYSCTAEGPEPATHTITVTSKAFVKVPDNLNAVEGEKFRIRCEIAGSPPPELSWEYSLSEDNETTVPVVDTDRIKIRDLDDVKNATLTISNVTLDDRGVYYCVGTTVGGGTVRAGCMVRVKDKYAAIWPFLGIVAEVVILCAIIFIYEKKHNKAELDESDTDQSPDQKNTPDHGKDSNLRHRQ